MKRLLFLIMFMGLANTSQGTETKFITENGFKSVWLWQLSNTTVVQDKGISLSKQSTQNYKTPHLLWTGKYINNEFYLGTAESSKIIKIDNNFQETEIFSSSNHSIIGAIVPDQSGILFSASPESQLIHLDQDHTIISNTSLSNTYIWDIVPNPTGGYYILTGLDAEVYEYNNYTLGEAIPIETEEHLLEGLYIDDTLWVLGEKALYKKVGNKFIAIAEFEGTASGFAYTNNRFYVVHSITQEENSTTDQAAQLFSTLSSISTEGLIEKLYTSTGFYFTSITIYNQQVIIGADQLGLYTSYDLITKKTSYSSLGEGKILEIFPVNDSLMFLSSDSSALWTINDSLALEGSFISEVYDTGNASAWGNFSAKISIPANTGVQFFVQSGVTANPNYWENWEEVQLEQKITVPQTRFIRYKAVLKSDGTAMPYIHEVKFPYTQLNISPSIQDVSIEQKNTTVVVSWTVSDPNLDSLEFDIWLADDGLPKIQINKRRITNTNFTFSTYLYPSGYKKITLIASDRPSNGDALTAEYTSIPIMFDSGNPIISDIAVTKRNSKASVSFSVEDEYSIIRKISYIIDGTTTINISPIDGIFDSKKEFFTFEIPLEKALFLQINSFDYANNIGTKGITILPTP